MNPQALLRGARRRVLLIVLAGGVPLALAAGALAMRLAGFDAGSVALTLALLAVATVATWRARRLDTRWLIARLDQQPRLEDSADLLFAAPETLNPLQQRQRARIEQRLRAAPPDLRPRWPWPRLAACFGAALLVAAATLLWPRAAAVVAGGHAASATAAAPSAPPALRGTRLQVTPPAYTGQPASAGA